MCVYQPMLDMGSVLCSWVYVRIELVAYLWAHFSKTVSLFNKSFPSEIRNSKTTCPGTLFVTISRQWAQLLKNILFFFTRTYRSSGLLYHAERIQGPMPHSPAQGIQGPLPHSLAIYSKFDFDFEVNLWYTQKCVCCVYRNVVYFLM